MSPLKNFFSPQFFLLFLLPLMYICRAFCYILVFIIMFLFLFLLFKFCCKHKQVHQPVFYISFLFFCRYIFFFVVLFF
uniref:Uncharacterized protein n=1 Tax=Meloidogyne enterolobii TaxID=390850 RepID=A0A6V7VLA7_MELEN|nr:unnamed protein product [Meloidogyne enterolobii]